ncbi:MULTISPECIES: agmatinase family protein [unclassified Solwaraspora]|uniref:agmatinase family protein n=1 Tax=unclassified Solwaraspora TaxID=2627926 RepID=UPI00248C0391|nr:MULTISPECIES: agmatinase family protein [unclassified Solwaraspora]WBB99568.1 agmatinase family protein [Solwaraspora sp. WMMA2059]WBC21882.1 agmatinase family protein [Solwaraspora sp. WMMA2080]WJK36073.1 agmatinase family protein [Solwaraspora sp. WMMA2065]
MSELPDFEALQNSVKPDDFEQDPLPGWAGLGTLFGAPDARGATPDLGGEGWAVAGIPFDGTASSRPGAAEGPRAIRQASLVFASYLNSLGEWQMLDTRRGDTFRYRAPRIADVGDLHTYPTNTVKTFQAVAAEARRVSAAAPHVIFLNGDHSCTFPTFAGFRAGRLDNGPKRFGFINIDHHFDFGNVNVLHGPLYHGSNSRRISEIPGIRPEDIAFVGVGDVTKYDQFRSLLDRGFHVVPGAQIRRDGAAAALAPVIARLGEQCDTVYISLDIDVLDSASATGTGHVTMGGISVGELLDVYEELRALPVVALDIAEVSPRYDPSGSTAQIAAHLLFNFLFRTDSQPSGLAPWTPGSTQEQR